MRKLAWSLAVPALIFIIAGALAAAGFLALSRRFDMVVGENARMRTVIASGREAAVASAVVPGQPTETPTLVPTLRPSASPTPTQEPPGYWALKDKPVPWVINCSNDVAWDGYYLRVFDYCVPGILTERSLNAQLPRDYYGALSSYDEGIMEAVEDRRGVARGHGVALTSCANLGSTAWLRVPGRGWDGPFVVIDCSRPEHLFYHVVVYGLAAEVGWTTAQRWGFRGADRVDVHIGSRPTIWDGVNLRDWWVAYGLEWEDGYAMYGGSAGTAMPPQ